VSCKLKKNADIINVRLSTFALSIASFNGSNGKKIISELIIYDD